MTPSLWPAAVSTGSAPSRVLQVLLQGWQRGKGTMPLKCPVPEFPGEQACLHLQLSVSGWGTVSRMGLHRSMRAELPVGPLDLRGQQRQKPSAQLSALLLSQSLTYTMPHREKHFFRMCSACPFCSVWSWKWPHNPEPHPFAKRWDRAASKEEGKPWWMQEPRPYQGDGSPEE